MNNCYQFHFKGYYKGEKIKVLKLDTNQNELFEVNMDYLLWTKKIDIFNGVLTVELIKFKKIS
jgi:hypothetical protein